MVNTLREGGEGRLFFLVYLPRTAGLSSSTCLWNVAPMGAAVLGNTVCRQPMLSRGVCTPSRQESTARRREKNPCSYYSTDLYTELMHMADEMICLQAYRKSDVRQDLFGNPAS